MGRQAPTSVGGMSSVSNASGRFSPEQPFVAVGPAAGQLQVNVPMAAAIQFLHNGRNEGLFWPDYESGSAAGDDERPDYLACLWDYSVRKEEPFSCQATEFNAMPVGAALGASRSSGGKIAFITLNTSLIKM